MKKILQLIIIVNLIFACKFSNAQVPNWQWAKSPGLSSNDFGNGICTDASGNVIAVGYFQAPKITFGTTTLTCVAFCDYYLVKYDPNGNVLWAKSAGGTQNDNADGVCTDNSGNIYITGGFDSPSLNIGSYTLINIGAGDFFIAKYNSGGTVLWAKNFGGTGTGGGTGGTSISADAVGNLYVTGIFSNTIAVGSFTLTSAGISDIFIAKFDAAGNVIWAKSAGGTGWDAGMSISSDPNGNAAVSGYFGVPTASFGTTVLNNVSVSGSSGDIFVARYDTNGNLLWVHSTGSSSNDLGHSVSSDAMGNVVFTGVCQGTYTLGTNTYTCSGGADFPIGKYDPGGNLLWGKNESGSGYDYGESLTTDALGNIYLTAVFDGTIAIGTNTFTSAGNYDFLIIKYDALSNVIWARSDGGSSSDQITEMCLDPGGNICVTGGFSSNPLILGNDTLYVPTGQRILIGKLNSTSTNITEHILSEAACIYPNPFCSETTLRVKESLNNATLTIYNSIGQIVGELKNLDGNTVKMPRNNLPEGIYFIQLSEGSTIISTGKIIVSNH